MSTAGDIAVGVAAGTVLTVAIDAAAAPPETILYVGGGAGVFLALLARSRTAGVALALTSFVGSIASAQAKGRPRGLGFRQ